MPSINITEHVAALQEITDLLNHAQVARTSPGWGTVLVLVHAGATVDDFRQSIEICQAHADRRHPATSLWDRVMFMVLQVISVRAGQAINSSAAEAI